MALLLVKVLNFLWLSQLVATWKSWYADVVLCLLGICSFKSNKNYHSDRCSGLRLVFLRKSKNQHNRHKEMTMTDVYCFLLFVFEADKKVHFQVQSENALFLMTCIFFRCIRTNIPCTLPATKQIPPIWRHRQRAGSDDDSPCSQPIFWANPRRLEILRDLI